MKEILREPAVEGQFYPSSQSSVEKLINSFKVEGRKKIAAKGVILPHAGYIYSGKVAVATIAKVIPQKKLIILGPNHTGLGKKFSIFPPKGFWQILEKKIAIDEELARKIISKGELIEEDATAHMYEHSIEVELPILSHFFGEFKFVPIVCSLSSLDIYQRVAQQIAQAIEDTKEEILVVASSDMSHYEPDAIARKKDRLAIEKIIELDEVKLNECVQENNITMCGIAPVSIMIHCVKLLKANKAEVILYQTSGDACGDYSSVVGYVGVILH